MQQLSRDEVKEKFGIRLVPSLEGVGRIDLNELRLEGRDRLVRDLNNFAQQKFDGKVTLVEEPGQATEAFHYKNLEDAKRRIETERRAEYQNALLAIDAKMAAPENASMIVEAMEATSPAGDSLRDAFAAAFAKREALLDFLNEGKEFTVSVQKLPETITLPAQIAKPGDTVYVVEAAEKKLPRLVEGKVETADFHKPFFGRKVDYVVGYKVAVDGKTEPFYSDLAEDALAKGHNKNAFGDQKSAQKNFGDLIDARTAAAQETLKQLRNLRRKAAPKP